MPKANAKSGKGKSKSVKKKDRSSKPKLKSNKKTASSTKVTLKKIDRKKSPAKKTVVKKSVVLKKKAKPKTAPKKISVKATTVKKAVTKKSGAKKQSVRKNTTAKKIVAKKAVKKSAAKKSLKEAVRSASAKLNSSSLKFASGRRNVSPDLPKPRIRKKPKNSKIRYNLNELKHFRDIILKEQRAILESARANMEALVDNESGEYKGDNLTYASHMAEQGTDEMEREKNYMFVQRDEKYLGYLQDALMRIDQGTYGICIDCKDEPKNLCRTCPLIPRERLEVVPITTHCIECKNLRSTH